MTSYLTWQRTIDDRRYWYVSRVIFDTHTGMSRFGCWSGTHYVMDDFGDLVPTY